MMMFCAVLHHRYDLLGETHTPDILANLCTETHCSVRCRAFLATLNNEVQELRRMTDEMFVGVCLDCFKAKGKFDGDCRFKHEK
jgi:hypothetical protein